MYDPNHSIPKPSCLNIKPVSLPEYRKSELGTRIMKLNRRCLNGLKHLFTTLNQRELGHYLLLLIACIVGYLLVNYLR